MNSRLGGARSIRDWVQVAGAAITMPFLMTLLFRLQSRVPVHFVFLEVLGFVAALLVSGKHALAVGAVLGSLAHVAFLFYLGAL